MPRPHCVSGEIELPLGAPPCRPVRVSIVLEDISRADAPSLELARLHLETGIVKGGDLIAFSLPVPPERIDDRSLYSVRAHLDMNGSGEVEKGDFISMQSYPVLTRGHGDRVRVGVRRV